VLGTLEGHASAIAIALAGPGAEPIVVTGTAEGDVVWWRPAPVHRALRGAVRALAVCGDRIAAAPSAGPIALFTTAGEPVAELAGSTIGAEAIACDPAGTLLAAAGQDRVLRVFRIVDSAAEVAALSGSRGDLHFVAFSPGGDLLVTAGNDGAVYAWPVADLSAGRNGRVDLATGSAADTATGSAADTAADTAAGTATGSATDTATGSATATATGSAIDTDTATATGSAIDTDTATATGSATDTATGSAAGTVVLHHVGGVAGLAFSFDGRWLASTGRDHVLRRRDLTAGREHDLALAGDATPVAFDAAGGIRALTRGGGVIHARAAGAAMLVEHGARAAVAIYPDRLAVALDDGAIAIESLAPRPLDDLSRTIERATTHGSSTDSRTPVDTER